MTLKKKSKPIKKFSLAQKKKQKKFIEDESLVTDCQIESKIDWNPSILLKKIEIFIKRYISSSNCVYECDRHKSGFFLGWGNGNGKHDFSNKRGHLSRSRMRTLTI